MEGKRKEKENKYIHNKDTILEQFLNTFWLCGYIVIETWKKGRSIAKCLWWLSQGSGISEDLYLLFYTILFDSISKVILWSAKAYTATFLKIQSSVKLKENKTDILLSKLFRPFSLKGFQYTTGIGIPSIYYCQYNVTIEFPFFGMAYFRKYYLNRCVKDYF